MLGMRLPLKHFNGANHPCVYLAAVGEEASFVEADFES